MRLEGRPAGGQYSHHSYWGLTRCCLSTGLFLGLGASHILHHRVHSQPLSLDGDSLL